MVARWPRRRTQPIPMSMNSGPRRCSRAAKYDWQDPLSAKSFQAGAINCRTSAMRSASEQDRYRVRTSTDRETAVGSSICEPAICSPLKERFEFSNHDSVEITELADEGARIVSQAILARGWTPANCHPLFARTFRPGS